MKKNTAGNSNMGRSCRLAPHAPPQLSFAGMQVCLDVDVEEGEVMNEPGAEGDENP